MNISQVQYVGAYIFCGEFDAVGVVISKLSVGESTQW